MSSNSRFDLQNLKALYRCFRKQDGTSTALCYNGTFTICRLVYGGVFVSTLWLKIIYLSLVGERSIWQDHSVRSKLVTHSLRQKSICVSQATGVECSNLEYSVGNCSSNPSHVTGQSQNLKHDLAISSAVGNDHSTLLECQLVGLKCQTEGPYIKLHWNNTSYLLFNETLYKIFHVCLISF